MSAEGTQQTLQTVLAQEAHCSERLLACLQAERRALSQRDMDALQQTTQEKLQHTQQLEQLEQQRETLVSRLGFATDSAGLKQCFNSLPQSDHLKRLWQQILSNIDACRNGNLTNGGILEASRQHVEQALCILRGQSGTPALYSPGGNTAADLGQRELGKV
jgi:flagella synthesis protein FlgN